MPPIPIDSPADPRLADYRDLKDAQLRALSEARGATGYPTRGVFIAEGELVVRTLLASRLRTRSVLVTPTRLATIGDALKSLPPGVPIFLASQEAMNAVVGFNIHRGILAIGERPEPPALPALLASLRSLVVLEDLANHDNVGGIFRAAAALAGPESCGVFYSPRTCDPFYRKAIRVSIGAVLRMPSAPLDPWPSSLVAVKEAGFTLIALTPHPAAEPIDRLPALERPALLLGAEGPGLSDAALAVADRLVRIPIAPDVDSLNVVVAAGIALQRLCRPRGRHAPGE